MRHLPSIFYLLKYLVRDIKQPILFSPIFSVNFSQLQQLKKKTNFLLVQNSFFSLFWTNEKLVFFFNCWSWEKFGEKIGKNNFGCLVVWCHEQDNIFMKYYLINNWKKVLCLLDFIPCNYKTWFIHITWFTQKMKCRDAGTNFCQRSPVVNK